MDAPDDDRFLAVTRSVRVPMHEIEQRFTASGGPGGQHANKTATRVELTLDLETSTAFGPGQRARVIERLGTVLRVVVDDERSQLRNRALAYERMAARLSSALHVDPPRRATRQSRGAKERRLTAKRQRSETKANRQKPKPTD